MIDPSELVEQRRLAAADTGRDSASAPPPPELKSADAERRLRVLRGLAKDGHSPTSIAQQLNEPVAAVLRDLPAAVAAGRVDADHESSAAAETGTFSTQKGTAETSLELNSAAARVSDFPANPSCLT